MKKYSIRKFVFPPGPILSLTLIGLLLLSAVLYYRAINMQRFLEPALAISQPRIDFAKNIRSLIAKEFGEKKIEGIKFTTGSIFVEESLLFGRGQKIEESEILKKLSRVFLSALKDPNIRAHINLILVSTTLPLSSDTELNKKMRLKIQHTAELILNAMYKAEPGLEMDYGTYFAATAMPMNLSEEEIRWVEFRIIPSELVHIELLQRLHKYVR